MSTSREALRLHDIIDNAERIAGYLRTLDVDGFVEDHKTVDATERCLERITEAAIKIGAERMASIAPDVPFHNVRGLGNRLRHAYDDIDLKLIWKTATVDIPLLKAACANALSSADDTSD